MFIRPIILRDPDPNGAANGAGAGAQKVKVPATGPVAESMLGQLLEQWDPQSGKVKDEPTTEPPAGGGDGANEPGDGAQHQNQDEPGSTDTGAQGDDAAGQLDETTQAHINELAELLNKGELTVGEVKRIKKLLARRGEDSEQITRLSEQVNELTRQLNERREEPPKGGTPSSESTNPFATLVKDEATLKKAKRDLYDIIEWCDENPDGGTRGNQEYTGEEVKAMRREARRGLDIHLPERGEELQRETQASQGRQQMGQWMKTNYPEFYDRENELGRKAQEFRSLPEVRNRPDADVIGAIMALGFAELSKREMARKAKTNGNGAQRSARPTTTVTKITLPPRPGGSALKPNNGDAMKKALAKVGKAPGREALTDVLEAMGQPGAARK